MDGAFSQTVTDIKTREAVIKVIAGRAADWMRVPSFGATLRKKQPLKATNMLNVILIAIVM